MRNSRFTFETEGVAQVTKGVVRKLADRHGFRRHGGCFLSNYNDPAVFECTLGVQFFKVR